MIFEGFYKKFFKIFYLYFQVSALQLNKESVCSNVVARGGEYTHANLQNTLVNLPTDKVIDGQNKKFENKLRTFQRFNLLISSKSTVL